MYFNSLFCDFREKKEEQNSNSKHYYLLCVFMDHCLSYLLLVIVLSVLRNGIYRLFFVDKSRIMFLAYLFNFFFDN